MKTLIFVYNADATLFAKVTDFAHKIISPETYSCHLCALTYGNFTIEKDWKHFIDNLEVPLSFLHKDEFEAAHGKRDEAMPAIFAEDEDGSLRLLISAEKINAMKDLESLKTAVSEAIKNF